MDGCDAQKGEQSRQTSKRVYNCNLERLKKVWTQRGGLLQQPRQVNQNKAASPSGRRLISLELPHSFGRSR